MRRLDWRLVAAVAVVVGVLAWLATRWSLSVGAAPVQIPWIAGVALIVAAAVVIAYGWQVRQYRAGNRPSLSALQAARTAVLGQAAAYAGAVFVGGYGGVAVALAAEWSHAPRQELVITALVATGGALVLSAAGFVTERWCMADDHDDDPPSGAPDAA